MSINELDLRHIELEEEITELEEQIKKDKHYLSICLSCIGDKHMGNKALELEEKIKETKKRLKELKQELKEVEDEMYSNLAEEDVKEEESREREHGIE